MDMSIILTVLEMVFWFFVFKIIFDILFVRQKWVIEQGIRDEVERTVHIVRAEEYQGIHYWWDRDSNEFLAQGKTVEEITKVIAKRFPDHYFFLNNNYVLHGPDWELIKLENNG